MVTVLSWPYCCTSFNAQAVIKCKNAYFIEARHFKHGKWLHEEINNIILQNVSLYLVRNQQTAIQHLIGLTLYNNMA